MKKELSIGKIFIGIMLGVTASLCAFMGVMAIKKSMSLNLGFKATPSIFCQIEMRKYNETNFTKIFSNIPSNEYLAGNMILNANTSTLTLNNSFNGGIGGGFELRILNYTTEKVFVSASGTGVSYTAVALDAVNGSIYDTSDNVIYVSAVSDNAVINFYKVESAFIETTISNAQFDMSYANNNLLKDDVNYYIPLGENAVGKLVTNTENAFLSALSINGTNQLANADNYYDFETGVFSLNNDDLGSGVSLNAEKGHFVNTTLSHTTLDLTYASNTLKKCGTNYYVPYGQNLVAKIQKSSGYGGLNYSLSKTISAETTSLIQDTDYTIASDVITLSNSANLSNSLALTAMSYRYYTTINASSGTFSNGAKTTAVGGETENSMLNVETPTRAGYSFNGWTGSALTTQPASTTCEFAKTFTLADYLTSNNLVTTDATTKTEEVATGNLCPASSDIATTFDGVDDYYKLGRKYMYTDWFTVNCWVYIADWEALNSVSPRIISCTEVGGWGTYGFWYQVRKPNGYNTVKFKPSTIIEGWNLITLYYDGIVLKSYVNGKLLSSDNATASTVVYNQNNQMLIGAEPRTTYTNIAGGLLQCQMKNVGISHMAMTDAEILALYNQSKNPSNPTLEPNAKTQVKLVESGLTLTANWLTNP